MPALVINQETGEGLFGKYFALIPNTDFEARRGGSVVELPNPSSPDIYERPMFTHGEWVARMGADGK